jgi:RNA polymerase sigma factor (sigma-70 family)
MSAKRVHQPDSKAASKSRVRVKDFGEGVGEGDGEFVGKGVIEGLRSCADTGPGAFRVTQAIAAAAAISGIAAGRRTCLHGTSVAGSQLDVRPVKSNQEWRLDFRSTFYLDLNVPVVQDQASGNGIAPSTQKGAAAFTTTHWSVVLAAQGETPAAQRALETLCRTYWRPIYGFVRRHGIGPEEAKDLTQGFFALLLERRDLNAVRQEKGRLRSYLLTSLKHFLTNERNRAMAIKRGEGQRLIPLGDLHERERVGFEPANTLAADQIYERRWALALLDQVLARLGDEYRAAGNTQLFDRLQKSLTDEPDRPSSADTAREFGMTEGAVRQASYRLRQRYRQLLHEEIAHTVMVPGDIEDELRHLIAVLRA